MIKKIIILLFIGISTLHCSSDASQYVNKYQSLVDNIKKEFELNGYYDNNNKKLNNNILDYYKNNYDFDVSDFSTMMEDIKYVYNNINKKKEYYINKKTSNIIYSYPSKIIKRKSYIQRQNQKDSKKIINIEFLTLLDNEYYNIFILYIDKEDSIQIELNAKEKDIYNNNMYNLYSIDFKEIQYDYSDYSKDRVSKVYKVENSGFYYLILTDFDNYKNDVFENTYTLSLKKLHYSSNNEGRYKITEY